MHQTIELPSIYIIPWRFKLVRFSATRENQFS